MDKNEQLFIQLVYLFQSTAMQGMGKMKNPVTDKIEENLEQAQQAIDMLEMLEDKTKGNLSEELKNLMESILTNLRLNYVAETGKTDKKEDADKKEVGEPDKKEDTDKSEEKTKEEKK